MPVKAAKRKGTATVEIPVLSQAATEAFDAYCRLSDTKSRAESTARKARTDREEQEGVVLGELEARLDGSLPNGKRGTLAKLADGRLIMVAREERQQRPQPAREYGWWNITPVSDGAV